MPQAAQTDSKRAPHSPQNFTPAGLSCWQRGQFISAPRLTEPLLGNWCAHSNVDFLYSVRITNGKRPKRDLFLLFSQPLIELADAIEQRQHLDSPVVPTALSQIKQVGLRLRKLLTEEAQGQA